MDSKLTVNLLGFAERDPEQIDWATDGVEIVLEATGFFAKKDAAENTLKGGAKKVVITAPGGSDVKTIVFNTNHDVLGGTETVISGASYYKTAWLQWLKHFKTTSVSLKV